jgi:hypothetical protein
VGVREGSHGEWKGERDEGKKERREARPGFIMV